MELPRMHPAQDTSLRLAEEKQGLISDAQPQRQSPESSSFLLAFTPASLPLMSPHLHKALTCEHCGLLSLMSRTKISTRTEAWNLPSEAVILSKYLAVCSRSRVFLEKILHSSPAWLMPNWPNGSPSKKMDRAFRSQGIGMYQALCLRWLPT